ncbi:MAG: hypothetical protein AAF376_07910 [Pseudomonadota bacterium]
MRCGFLDVRRCLLALAVILAAPSATAQEPIGRAVIDGREVVLYSDFSWDFASADEADASDCTFVDHPISFCGDTSVFVPVRDSGNPDVDAMFRVSDRLFAMLIVEDFGRDVGVTEEALTQIVIENLASAAGVSTADIRILETEDARVSNTNRPSIVYGGELDGVSIVYANTLVVEADHSAQLITYSIGSTYSDAHRRVNERFLQAIRIAK